MDERPRNTHYDELGVTPGAGQKKIEEAYWVRRFAGGDTLPGSSLASADRAYLVLSDPLKRRAYDRRIGIGRHPAWAEERSRAAKARTTYRRALTLAGRRREGEALKLMKQCVRLSPDNALYRSSMALLMARTGHGVEKGVRFAMDAYRQSPADHGVVENVAAVCELAGLKRRASGLRRSLRVAGRKGPTPP
jgi:hypothetical protein